MPAAEHVATENRLPIFEAVESDWFRRGRSGVPAGGVPAGGVPARGAPAGGGRVGSTALDGGSGRWSAVQPAPDLASEAPSEAAPEPEPDVSWRSSAADQGWEAAAAAISPTTGGTTDAGLPKRVPQANLVPGAAPPEAVAPVPARSAAVTRDRFASFQRGVREGRAAVSREDESPDVDGGS